MTSPATSAPLLLYTLSSTPDPVVVSEPGSPATCTLTIVVSCPDPAILPECQVSGIELYVPVRDEGAPGDASYLTDADPPLSSVTYADQDPNRKWTVTRPIKDQYGVYVLIPAYAGQKAGTPVTFEGKGVTFTIARISVTNLVGTATIVVCEWASSDPHSPPALTGDSRQISIPVAKFPSRFQLSQLSATSQLIEAGQGATLVWDGTPTATYKISYLDVVKERVPSTTTHQEWPSRPLVADTEFTLDVCASQDNNTVKAQRKLLVDVALPQVISFTATPQSPVAGQNVTLSWQSAHADGVYLTVGNGQQLTFGLNTTSYTLIAGGATDCWLTAFKNVPTGSPVRSSQDHLGLNVLMPQVTSFTASPNPLDKGQSAQLQWASVNAAGVRLQAAGSAAPVNLPAVSDPTKPYWSSTGVSGYTMWAYQGEVLSAPSELTIGFNPVRVDGCSVRFNQVGGDLYLAFTITAHNATDVEVQIYRAPNDPAYQFPTGMNVATGFYPDWHTTIQISGFTAPAGFQAHFTVYAKGSPRNIMVTGHVPFEGTGITVGAYLDAPLPDPNPS